MVRCSSLYPSYDLDFASNFSLEAVESVHPVHQTPWCGNKNALDPRGIGVEGTSRNMGVQEDFNRSYEAAHRDDQSAFHIVRVETPEYEAFVFDFTDVDSGEAGEWFDDVVTSYKCAMRLGAFVQTPVFGDGWWGFQPFDGEHMDDRFNKEGFSINRPGIAGRLCWDAARMTIVGHREFGPSSLLFGDGDEYRYGSFELSGNRLSSNGGLAYLAGGDLMRELTGSSSWFSKYVHATVALSLHLQETGLLNPYANDVIQDNRDYAQTLFEELIEVETVKRYQFYSPFPASSFLPPEGEVEPVIQATDRRSLGSSGGASDE